MSIPKELGQHSRRSEERLICESFSSVISFCRLPSPMVRLVPQPHRRRAASSVLKSMGCDMPAQPAVMILGGLATLVGLVLLPLGQVPAWIAWPFLDSTIYVVEATTRLPFASIGISRLDLLLVVLRYKGKVLPS
jgi:hypothetical protein